nr:hypothetical protein [Bradyrhizobium paxllaeri]
MLIEQTLPGRKNHGVRHGSPVEPVFCYDRFGTIYLIRVPLFDRAKIVALVSSRRRYPSYCKRSAAGSSLGSIVVTPIALRIWRIDLRTASNVENLHRIPSARTIARLMTVGQDTLSKAETVTVAAIEAGVPTLVEAREIIAEFHLMIRRRSRRRVVAMDRARSRQSRCLIRPRVTDDEAAVRAAITLPWSNGGANEEKNDMTSPRRRR